MLDNDYSKGDNDDDGEDGHAAQGRVALGWGKSATATMATTMETTATTTLSQQNRRVGGTVTIETTAAKTSSNPSNAAKKWPNPTDTTKKTAKRTCKKGRRQSTLV